MKVIGPEAFPLPLEPFPANCESILFPTSSPSLIRPGRRSSLGLSKPLVQAMVASRTVDADFTILRALFSGPSNSCHKKFN